MLDSNKLMSLIFSMLNQGQQPAGSLSAKKQDPFHIRETGEEVIVALEAPGIQKRDDVQFSIGVTRMTVRGIRKKMTGLDQPINSEDISAEKFERAFTLPYPVRPETAIAIYSKGILEIRIKKLPEKTWDKVFVQFL
ncbi:MAG: Hsp20/alpha crystallin family protein [Bacillota bacterium]